ncbi:MAG TPA: hypothetical protein QGF58_23840, partial [Myxococcota bacterium]|nr:hypothetical protein [Myxococcota bacterium]
AQVPLGLDADDAVVHGDRLYLRVVDRLVEVRLHEGPDGVVVAQRVVGQVAERATQLFPGVAVQSLLGAAYVHLLDDGGAGPGRCPQVRLAELDDYRVVDARYDRGVLMVVGARGDGRYDRLVFRIDGARRDLRVVEDVDYSGLDFVVLDRGLCLHLAEDERLEAFPVRPDDAARRVVEDDALGGDLRLLRYAGQAAFVRGDVVCRVSLR